MFIGVEFVIMQYIKAKRILRLTTFTIIILTSGYLLHLLTVLQGINYQISQYLINQTKDKVQQVLKLDGSFTQILIISNQPHQIIAQDLRASLQQVEDRGDSVRLYVAIIGHNAQEFSRLNHYKETCVRALSNYHIVSSQVIFINDFILNTSLQQVLTLQMNVTSPQMGNLQYIILDQQVPQSTRTLLYNLIQPIWVFKSTYRSKIEIIHKQKQLYENQLTCPQLFDEVLSSTQMRLKQDTKRSGLVVSQSDGQLGVLRDLGAGVRGMKDWMYREGIQVLYIGELSSTYEYMQIFKYILAILSQTSSKTSHQFTLTLKLKKSSAALKLIKKNLILNDIQIDIEEYSENPYYSTQLIQDKQLKKIILFTTMSMLVTDLDAIRGKIITEGLKVVVSVVTEELAYLDDVAREFIVLPVQEIQQMINKRPKYQHTYTPGIYIVHHPSATKKMQVTQPIKDYQDQKINIQTASRSIATQTNKARQQISVHGYKFIISDIDELVDAQRSSKNRDSVTLSPKWTKTNLVIPPSEALQQNCFINENPKIQQYFLFKNIQAHSQLILSLQKISQQYKYGSNQALKDHEPKLLKQRDFSILWCLGYQDNRQLFYLLGMTQFVDTLGLCSQLSRESAKEFVRIAVLNDFVGKVLRNDVANDLQNINAGVGTGQYIPIDGQYNYQILLKKQMDQNNARNEHSSWKIIIRQRQSINKNTNQAKTLQKNA